VGRSITRRQPDDDTDDPVPAKREKFRTEGGRTVYGGGGITPDVIAGDTVTPVAEVNFMRALGSSARQFRDAVTDYALHLKGRRAIASADFEVTPAMRDEVWRRMTSRGVNIPRDVFVDAEAMVSRFIAFDIARYVFGPEAEFRRRAASDRALQKALELARGATSGQDLFRRASAALPPDTVAVQ
jgi:carboxyl-terminal processing protease